MKPPAIIAPAVDVASIAKRVRAAHVAVQDAERAEQVASKTAEQKREIAGRARLELGRTLIEARKAWPSRGPRAKGWGDFLRDAGIEERSARNFMALAGYSDVSETDGVVSEIPTYRDAGIDRRERKSEAPESDTAWTEEDRRAVYDYEARADAPPPMPVREARTHEWIEIARDMRALACRWEERKVHLIDVSTSPDDFMRAKQLAIDVVNRCLAELDAAGVLDKKEGRRQLQLLDGGKQ